MPSDPIPTHALKWLYASMARTLANYQAIKARMDARGWDKASEAYKAAEGVIASLEPALAELAELVAARRIPNRGRQRAPSGKKLRHMKYLAGMFPPVDEHKETGDGL